MCEKEDYVPNEYTGPSLTHEQWRRINDASFDLSDDMVVIAHYQWGVKQFVYDTRHPIVQWSS